MIGPIRVDPVGVRPIAVGALPGKSGARRSRRHASIVAMRSFAWLFLGAIGCGSVSNSKLPDAPPPGDGSNSSPPGTIRWVRSLSSMEALGVADGAGGLVVTGAINAPANLGGQALIPVGGFDMVVAGFDSDTADHLYSVRHGDVGSEFGFLHHVDAQGSPMVHGVSYGTVDLGLGQMAGGNGADATLADGFIGHFGPSAPAWVARIVGTGEDKIVATAPAAGSTIYGGGWFEGTTTFTHGTTAEMLTSAGGRDIFLARFNTFTGNVDLTRRYGGTGRDELSSAASNAGGLTVAGMFDDTLAFGGTAQPVISNGGLDVWVARLDASGNGIWAVHHGGTGDDRDPRIAVDAAGDVYVAGMFTNQVAFGAINLVAKGDTDIFVAKLRGSDGSVAWAISRGTAMTDRINDLAVDAAGHVVLSGWVNGLPTAAGDGLLENLDAANGSSRWQKMFATPGSDSSGTVTFGRNGELYALVGLGGPFDFGVPIIGAASPAAVMLRIVP